jgi:hypothetical protein
MIATAEGRQATIEANRAEAYEAWRHELLADSRLAPFRILWQDIMHFGEVGDETWQRFQNEKYSRFAERMTDTHHERPDYYVFDAETNDVVVYEDPVKGRYTLRDVYENGLRSSQVLTAERGERFAFQLQRDEIFMQSYEHIEAMMRGETDYDTIVMVSTFPVEELAGNQDALKEKFYDLDDGKQFEYVFKRIELENGAKILGMGASTLYSPQEVLQLRTMHGKAALAAVQHSHGAQVPYTMVSSHEQNRYIATFNAEGAAVEDIMAADAAVYDTELKRLTGRDFDHGREDVAIDAYTLFDHCQNDWAAYKAYYEMFARHMAGDELNPYLRDHLLNLLSDYRRLGKTNNVTSGEGLNRLFQQVWYGRITPDMQLACNEIMDYAHSALMKKYMTTYKQTGVLPQQNDGGDILASYSGDSGNANGNSVESGDDFNECEGGNGVSDVSAAAALAKETGMSLEEALRAVKKKSSVPYNASLVEKYGAMNVFLGKCGACGSHGEVGPCGPGFCNTCDTRDRVQRGYIADMYKRRQSQKTQVAQSKYGEKASLAETPKPTAGPRIRTQLRLTVGGVEEVVVDESTGLEVS